MLNRREALRAKVAAPLPKDINAAAIAETKALITDLQATYPNTYNEHLPRTAVAEALSRLFAMHSQLVNLDAAENAMLEMLKTLRVLELSGRQIVPLGGQLEEATVINVLLLADLQKKARQAEIAKKLEDFAQQVYLVLNGSMEGYDKIVVPGL